MGDDDGPWSVERMPALDGRVVVVTGANSGVGLAAAREFARAGATTVLACRDIDRGERARGEVAAAVPEARVDARECDLGDLRSVRAFAEGVLADYDTLDVLCNNAAVMAIPYRETVDGFEYQFGVNHLGHFALTGHLIDRLVGTRGETRVVTQTCSIHRDAELNRKWLARTGGGREQEYDKWNAYGRSKLANVVFAYELDRRLKGVETTSVACHPGFVDSNIRYHGAEMADEPWRLRLTRALTALFGQSPENGALPMLRAATDPDVEGGTYYGPGGHLSIRGAPESQQPGEKAFSRQLGERLWELSEDLTGVEFDLTVDRPVRDED